MKQPNLKNRLRTAVVILGISVLLLWALFYMNSTRFLENSTEKVINQVSEQVMYAMETEFLSLEHMAFSLSQSPKVKDFVKEKDATVYHQKSAEVSSLIATLNQPSSLVEDLIIYSDDKVYSRFIGTLGNTAATKVLYSIQSGALPQHLALDLEGAHYVGYANGIYDGGRQIGTVVLLMEEDRLLGLFQEYNRLDYIAISLASGGKIITSSDNRLTGKTIEEVKGQASSFQSRKIGVTPFSICVTSDDSYMSSMRGFFTVAVSITALLLILLLVLFFAFWNRYFFKPMLSVMQGVELLGTQEEINGMLGHTGEENFDRLVEQINSMLGRLDEKNKALTEARLKLQDAEIERQKSVIISLKKQINAHFTVNVLNSIKLLAEKQETKKAREMCDGMSYLLRYANAGDEYIGGLEEFFILEKYISIMSIRYPNRFTADFDIDDRLDDVALPRMLVQPIVENAILHGFKMKENGGVIRISALLEQEKIIITVTDNGCGMEPDTLDKLRQKIVQAPMLQSEDQGLEHIALPNIQKRVQSYYGSSYGLTVQSEMDIGTTVTLTLPTGYK